MISSKSIEEFSFRVYYPIKGGFVFLSRGGNEIKNFIPGLWIIHMAIRVGFI